MTKTQLNIGLDVDIQRTNGRIHSAVVSSIDWNNQSVTVEWSEQEEVKGKEIDFESLIKLNPTIGLTPSASAVTHGTASSTASSNSTAITSTKKTIPPPKSLTSAGTGAASGLQQTQSMAKGSLRVRPTGVGLRRETIANGNGFLNQQQHQLHASIPEHQTPAAFPSSNTLYSNMNTGSVKSNLNQLASGVHTRSSAAAAAAAAAMNANNSDRRRSNVVKEVDKIKKQREERREQQERQRMAKSDLMAHVEPGNPNWEFLGMIQAFRASQEIRPIGSEDPVDVHQICVAVRKRPMNKKELSKKDIDVITIPRKDLVLVHEPKQKVDLTRYLQNHEFRFDYAFDENSDNEVVYRYTAKPLVQTIFDGGMATCFAYGQTGSGKTHTMGGDFQGKGGQDSSKGIYGLVAKDVFRLLRSPKHRADDLVVVASFFEIYSGKVFDLLNGKAKLRVLEDARNQVQIVGLLEKAVEKVEDVLNLIACGNNIRTSGQTSANNHSSRSHAVFQLSLKQRKPPHRLRGKFSLIDLAGNERGADTSSADRTVRMEGAEINKSLLALKECIRALGRKGAHLPFRASKLTQVLRDSFIGENARTCMIAMISPGMQSCEHTLNTLRYADRVKELGTESPDMKSNDDEVEDMQVEDDLAILQHSNSVEMNEDYFNFQQAISHLQEMEDDVVESHRNYVENHSHWIKTHNTLLLRAAEVDYDVDSYAQKLELTLTDQFDQLQKLREKVRDFRAHLAEEEQISKKIVKRKK